MQSWGPVAGIAVLLVAACGSPAIEVSSGPPTSQSPSTSPSATEPDPVPSSATPSPSDADPVATSSPEPPIIEPSAGVPQKLVLADAFNSEGWEEGSFKPAGKPAEVDGFVTMVTCYQDIDRALEFRLGAQPGQLKFTVVQELRSESAANTLAVAVEADGRVKQTRNIDFKGSADFDVDVTGVASLRILVSRVKDRNDDCKGASTALIYGTELSG